MEEEEHTDRKQKLAMLYQKLNKIKKYLNEGNKGLTSSHVCQMSALPCISVTLCACYR